MINTTAAVVPGLVAQGAGALGIVSSVAGYRGLPKAFTRKLKLLRLLPYRWYFALIRTATGL